MPALIAAFGIDFLSLGITALLPPANLAPIIIGAWMVIGLALLIYFATRDPGRITQTGRVFIDEAVPVAEREARPARS